MSSVLFFRVFKRQLLGLGIYALVLFLFQILMVWLYPSFQDSLSLMFDEIPPIFKGMLGGEHLSFATLPGFLTMGITHPLVLLVLVLYPIKTAVSSIAEEISQKTGDLLFTRPIRRYQIILTYLINLCIGSLLLSFSIISGLEVGFLLVEVKETLSRTYLLQTMSVIFSLLLAIGGLTFLISVLLRDAKKSLAIAGGCILFMYVMDFLIPFWDGLERVSPFFLFHYFRPGDILLGEGGWVKDSLLLLFSGIFFTILSLFSVERMDL